MPPRQLFVFFFVALASIMREGDAAAASALGCQTPSSPPSAIASSSSSEEKVEQSAPPLSSSSSSSHHHQQPTTSESRRRHSPDEATAAAATLVNSRLLRASADEPPSKKRSNLQRFVAAFCDFFALICVDFFSSEFSTPTGTGALSIVSENLSAVCNRDPCRFAACKQQRGRRRQCRRRCCCCCGRRRTNAALLRTGGTLRADGLFAFNAALIVCGIKRSRKSCFFFQRDLFAHNEYATAAAAALMTPIATLNSMQAMAAGSCTYTNALADVLNSHKPPLPQQPPPYASMSPSARKSPTQRAISRLLNRPFARLFSFDRFCSRSISQRRARLQPPQLAASKRRRLDVGRRCSGDEFARVSRKRMRLVFLDCKLFCLILVIRTRFSDF